MKTFNKLTKEEWAEFDLTSLVSGEPKKKINFTGGNVLAEKLWYIALEDAEKNYCIETEYGTVYAAGNYGNAWQGLTFNRDTALSGILGLNALYPEEMLVSLKVLRKYRIKLGLSCIPSWVLEGIEGVTVYNMDLESFKKRFYKSSAINKTDDIVWLWCAYDLLMKHGYGVSEWKWMYETAKECFEKLYSPFYDIDDGLYFGQDVFVDIGLNGYPEEFGNRNQNARNKGVWIKASSTNALYYKGLRVMAEAAEKLQLSKEKVEWSEKAEKLKTAIIKKLRLGDGTFAHFMHKDGHLENRRNVLGTAFPIICDVVTGQDAKKALQGYPITAYGAPLIYPFYNNSRDDVLHDNSSWPFADTFMLLAAEKAWGRDLTDLNLHILINSAKDGHLYEFRNLIYNGIACARAQLWTIAAYINVCVRKGYTELNKETVKIY